MTVSFESLFESIKLIAENVVKAIKFDETKFCTIVDDSDKKQGKYLVEEGDIQFEAISESQTFNKGDKVRVSFVMGDINNPKYIIGKAVDINSEDILVDYVSPLDTVVDISGNLMDNFATYYPNDSTAWSIMANGNLKDKLIATLDLSESQELQNRSVYETIFMTAEFRSLMSEYRMKQGNYGIRIELFNEAGQRVGGDMIDSSEMFGSPYRFTIYTKQEKKGDIKNAGPISRIDVYLYQNNNFEYYSTTGEELDLNPDDFGDMDNIWVKNIALGFGSEVTSIEDNTLEIYSNESYTYNSDTQTEEKLKRNLRVIWYNKDKNNRYIGFGDAGKPEEENKAGYIKYSLDWYNYSPGNNKEEEGIPVVQDWKYKGSDGLPTLGLMKPEENDYQSVSLNGEIREDKFKAILRITERINDYNFIYNEESEDSEEDQKKAYDEEDKVENIQYITVESNILTFTNEATLIDTLAADANNGALYIEHGDFSQAGYSFYDEVNVIDKSYEALRERKLYVRFNGLSGKDDQIDGATVYWYVPNTLTMLSFNEENLIDETKGLGYQKLEETHPRYKENYTCYYKILSQFNSTDTGNIDATGGLISRTFLYKVKDYYSESYKNNTILCEVDKGKITFKAEISFVFSTKGIAGTDYTLVVAPVGKRQAPTASTNLELGISLYDPSGKIIPIDKEKVEFTWEGIKEGWGEIGEPQAKDNILIYTIDAPALTYGEGLPILKINVEANLDFSTETEGTTESRKLNLITYYPMSYTNGEYYANSPTFITYRDNNINPSYQKDPYQLFDNIYNPINATWENKYFPCDSSIPLPEEEIPFLPSLTETNNLLPKNLYISNPTGYLVVWGKGKDSEGSEIIWGQAVKVLKNRYLSTTLNQWNGELKIDKENNTIFTAMVGAGKKNSDNSFSGVVMGEFEKLDDGTYATGLRGYHKGEKSFEFDINGTATLGKSGRGQIRFDGNEGTIKSASYSEGNIGMLLDLDNGIIDLRGSKPEKDEEDNIIGYSSEGKGNIHIDITSPYFTISSPNPNRINEHLIYIGNDNYYLQSENYKEVLNGEYDLSEEEFKEEDEGQGTRLDLSSGVFDSYGLTLRSKYLLADSKISDENKGPFFALKNPDNKILILAQNQEAKFNSTNKTKMSQGTNYFIKSPNYQYLEGEEESFGGMKPHQGILIDLDNGMLAADHYYITGRGAKQEGGYYDPKIFLNTQSPENLLTVKDEYGNNTITVGANGLTHLSGFVAEDGLLISMPESWKTDKEYNSQDQWGYFIPQNSGNNEYYSLNDGTIKKRSNIYNIIKEDAIIEQEFFINFLIEDLLNNSAQEIKSEINNIFKDKEIQSLHQYKNFLKLTTGKDLDSYEDIDKNDIQSQLRTYKFTYSIWSSFKTEIERIVFVYLAMSLWGIIGNSVENYSTFLSIWLAYGKEKLGKDGIDYPNPFNTDSQQLILFRIKELATEELNNYLNTFFFIPIFNVQVDFISLSQDATFEIFYTFIQKQIEIIIKSQIAVMSNAQIRYYLDKTSKRDAYNYLLNTLSNNNYLAHNIVKDGNGKNYSIAIGGKILKPGNTNSYAYYMQDLNGLYTKKEILNEIDLDPFKSYGFKVTQEGKLYLGNIELTPHFLAFLINKAKTDWGYKEEEWLINDLVDETIPPYPSYPVDPQYITLTTLTGNDGSYNNSTQKGFWIAPRRSIKIEASAIRISASEVQVDLRLTYKILSSSSGSYSNYSQYFTPSFPGINSENISPKPVITKLKSNSPSNWYGSPITKSIEYIVPTTESTLPFSILFTSIDDADKDITYTATLNVI